MIPDENRVAWVDYAKGFCIIMVVMMHSTLGVEKAADATGWMTYVVAFAKPFRMPDFFMISGLFLARVIDRDWRTYLDKKVVHFAYFYVLWLTIQFIFKAPSIAGEGGSTAHVLQQYALAFIDPFGTIWFIYLLPIFFVLVKLTRRVPWPIIWLIGAGLEMASVNTGWTIPDEFAARFVYFYSGYVFAPYIFRFAATVLKHGWLALTYLVVWALLEAYAVFGGYSELPGIGLALGFVGAIAVVTLSTVLSKSDWMAAVRYCGRNSIVIYLAFFLPMATARTLLLKFGVISDLGTVSLIVTAAAVILPLVLFWVVRDTPARFLFERPQWARLTEPRRAAMVPAE
ncbi:MAG TPA: acyltransferase family protein [Bauldia sp.]|nr:acyltransferase family protein [Bauldia sp.]